MLFLAGTDVCTEDLKVLLGFVQGVLNIIKIGIPILLIIWGTLDLGRAVIASDEKKIKENQQILLKRALAAALVFLLSTIVGFVMSFVGGNEWKSCWNQTAYCGADQVWDASQSKCVAKK